MKKIKVPNIPKCPPVPLPKKLKVQKRLPKNPNPPPMPKLPAPRSGGVLKNVTIKGVAFKAGIIDTDKFYNLIKKKVKFDGDLCNFHCDYRDVEFCSLFCKTIPEIKHLLNKKRCRQCKTYFGK